jgi:hypothetical protein
MTPVIMATPMPVTMRSDDGTRSGPNSRAAPATNGTANDCTTHSAASGRTLCHGIREGHRKPQRY